MCVNKMITEEWESTHHGRGWDLGTKLLKETPVEFFGCSNFITYDDRKVKLAAFNLWAEGLSACGGQ